MERVRIKLRVGRALLKSLNRMSKRQGKSRSELFREAMEAYFYGGELWREHVRQALADGAGKLGGRRTTRASH